MSARVLAATVAAVVWLASVALAGDPHMPLPDLVRDLSRLDGRRAIVGGTLGAVRAHISKKGSRSYTFGLSDGPHNIIVLAAVPPACGVGAVVTVEGIVDARARRIEATAVSCP